jgi:Uma2 family endonuclease
VGSELKRKLDYTDYLAAPDDGQCYEIVDGDLYVTPAPNPFHQRVSKRLQVQLMNYFEGRSYGEVFVAPIDLILTLKDVVRPDLLVVADPNQVSSRGIEGAPLLVVEILSPSTYNKDRTVKARRYAELGIPHYWIVDHERKRLECHRLVSGSYRLLVEAEGNTNLEHPDWEGLVLDLTELWR